MIEPQHALKQPAKVALAALAVLLVGAVVFYKERALFGDDAYIVFSIINNKKFAIQEHRYGSFITQMVPYLGQQLHLPLKAILIGYSVSFTLFYLSVATLFYRYKQYSLAVLIALYYFLFVTDSYFWTNNEIHQAVGWMFLMFGVTIQMGKRNVKMPILIPVFTMLAFLTVFTHFVVIIPFVFLWMYFLLEKDRWPFSRTVSILLAVIVLLAVTGKFMVTMNESYDGKALYDVTHFSLLDIWLSFSTPVIHMFLQRAMPLYWVSVLILLLGIVGLIKTKQKTLVAWTVLSALGYFVIMGLTYSRYDNNFSLFHVESEWASLSIIIAAPFVFAYLPSLKPKHAIILLVAIFVIRIAYIGSSIPAFRWRTGFKEQVLAQMKKKGITKLGLYEEPGFRAKLLLDWALPEESLLTSAMAGDNPQLSFRLVNKDDTTLINSLKNPVGLSSCFTWHVQENMNEFYYKIDTTRPYAVMSYGELMK